MTMKFFHDPAGAEEITALAPLYARQDTLGTLPPVDLVVYLGTLVAGDPYATLVNPGVDPIVASVVDSGTGEPASAVKLALTESGLDTATGGAPLNLPATIDPGAINFVQLWVRVDDSAGVAGDYLNLKLQLNAVARWGGA